MKERRVEWVDDQRGLDVVGRELEGASEFGLDTEQDSFYAYRTKVCLMQVSAHEREWIVDVLALDDFSPLLGPFADPARITIMHAGENDVDLLRRCCDLEIRGIFDTMAAAQVIGYRRTGLAGLLAEHFNVTVEKKFQRSDWRRRPLTHEQIEYAALDVRYLSPLRAALEGRLLELGRINEARSEFRRIERVVHSPKKFDPDDFVRIRGAQELSGEQLRVLRELFTLRDEVGRAEDRAVFRVCGDAVLLEIANRMPESRAELGTIRGLSARFLNKQGDRIVTLIRDAERLGGIEVSRRTRKKPPSDQLRGDEKRLLEHLRRWRETVAAERDVEPGRVIPTKQLVDLIRAGVKNRRDLQRAGLEAWRIKEYGVALLAILTQR